MSAVMPVSATRLRAELEEFSDSMSVATQIVLESLIGHPEVKRDMESVLCAVGEIYRLAHEELGARHFQSSQIPAEEEMHRIRHDLRNLLQNVLLRCEFAADEASLPEQVREDIGRLRRSASECVSAVNSNRDVMASGDVSLRLLELNAPAGPEAPPEPSLPSRILVADDSALSREMLTRFLSREGHSVSVATDGCEALRMAQAEELDLILLDIQMPEMNGFEVLDALRCCGVLTCTPVILISGMDGDSAAVRGIGLGADDFLPRPLNLKLLRARVNSSLERQRLREAELARYFTPRLARQLRRHPQLLATGRRTEVSTLFCDIVGFTCVSERLGPEQTIGWLSAVLAAMSACVMAEDGVLVDYTGDQIMALWGAPHDQSDHAIRACRCAAAMMEALPALNEAWRGIVVQDTAVSIGINSGDAFVGNIGTPQKFKFGALGNTVNLASRAQGAARHLRAPVLLTGATRASAGAEFSTRRLGWVRVNNIEEPVELYELIPFPATSTASLVEGYESALAHCEAGALAQASHLLRALLEAFPNDGPSLLLMSRIIGDEFESVYQLPGK